MVQPCARRVLNRSARRQPWCSTGPEYFDLTNLVLIERKINSTIKLQFWPKCCFFFSVSFRLCCQNVKQGLLEEGWVVRRGNAGNLCDPGPHSVFWSVFYTSSLSRVCGSCKQDDQTRWTACGRCLCRSLPVILNVRIRNQLWIMLCVCLLGVTAAFTTQRH